MVILAWTQDSGEVQVFESVEQAREFSIKEGYTLEQYVEWPSNELKMSVYDLRGKALILEIIAPGGVHVPEVKNLFTAAELEAHEIKQRTEYEAWYKAQNLPSEQEIKMKRLCALEAYMTGDCKHMYDAQDQSLWEPWQKLFGMAWWEYEPDPNKKISDWINAHWTEIERLSNNVEKLVLEYLI